jgi:hypothetical protein
MYFDDCLTAFFTIVLLSKLMRSLFNFRGAQLIRMQMLLMNQFESLGLKRR